MWRNQGVETDLFSDKWTLWDVSPLPLIPPICATIRVYTVIKGPSTQRTVGQDSIGLNGPRKPVKTVLLVLVSLLVSRTRCTLQ